MVIVALLTVFTVFARLMRRSRDISELRNKTTKSSVRDGLLIIDQYFHLNAILDYYIEHLAILPITWLY